MNISCTSTDYTDVQNYGKIKFRLGSFKSLLRHFQTIESYLFLDLDCLIRSYDSHFQHLGLEICEI